MPLLNLVLPGLDCLALRQPSSVLVPPLGVFRGLGSITPHAWLRRLCSLCAGLTPRAGEGAVYYPGGGRGAFPGKSGWHLIIVSQVRSRL